MVPKIIHQIWMGSPVPRAFENFSNQWKVMHPGWDYQLWDESGLRWLDNQNIFDNAHLYAKPDAVYQMKSDLARYEILYKHGGVYIDMDTQPLKAIDELINVPAFAVWEVEDEWIANGILGSEPGNDFLRKIIDGIPNQVKGKKEKDATFLAGPRYFSSMFFQHKPNMTIYPTHYFLPYLHREVREGQKPELEKYDGSYAVHHWNHARTVRNIPMHDV